MISREKKVQGSLQVLFWSLSHHLSEHREVPGSKGSEEEATFLLISFDLSTMKYRK